MTRSEPRLIVTYGMVMLAISFFMRAQLTAQADYMSVATAMFVLGAGVPACLITMTSLGVADLPPHKVANGSGLQSSIRIMCMATGASLTSTYSESATKENGEHLVSLIEPTMTFTDRKRTRPKYSHNSA